MTIAYVAGDVPSVELYSGVESQVVTMTGGTHASATRWYNGDLVVTTSGVVNNIASYGAITGIAMDDASATSYVKLDIALIDPTAIYVMRVDDNDTSTRDVIGLKYPLVFTAGDQRVNTDGTSNEDVYIIGIHPEDKGTSNAGITEGRVLVRFVYTTFTGV